MTGKKTEKRRDDIVDPRLVKLLAHPLRVRILGILEERTASPSEISGELDASLGVVSYHVRRLEALGLIKLVRKVPRRGAVEHYYRADAKHQIPDTAWARLPDIVRQAMAGAALGEISAKVNAAAVAGGFGADDAHLSLTNLTLDAKGWQAIAKELARMLDQVDRIQAESAARLEELGDDAAGAEIQAMVAMMLFEAADSPAPSPAPAKPRRRARTRAAG